MGMKGRLLAVLAGVAIVAGIAVTAAFGAHKADPGISASTITIGGTFPLTGPASLYKTIPAAEKAYFDYINDHGGVNGRKIDFKIVDDGVRPLEDGAAHAAARRAGQGLRGLRQPRHRAEPRDLGLPEQAEGPARAARDRRLVLGLLGEEVPVHDRLPAGLSG